MKTLFLWWITLNACGKRLEFPALSIVTEEMKALSLNLTEAIVLNKEFAYNARDLGLIPGSGRFLGEGNGNPLQCYHLENPKDRGAWWAI